MSAWGRPYASRRRDLAVLGIVFFAALAGPADRCSLAAASGEILVRGLVTDADRPEVKINGQATRLLPDGSFEWRLKSQRPRFVQLDVAPDYEFYARPGQTLDIRLNAKSVVSSIQATGGEAAITRYLLDEWAMLKKAESFFSEKWRELFALDEASYMARIAPMREEHERMLETFLSEHPEAAADEYFVRIRRAAVRYIWSGPCMNYARYHGAVSGDNNYVPSERLRASWSNLDPNNDELIEFGWYLLYLRDYAGTLRAKEKRPVVVGQTYPSVRLELEVIKNNFASRRSREYLVSRLLDGSPGDYNPIGSEDLYRELASMVGPDARNAFEEPLATAQELRRRVTSQIFKKVDGFELEALIFRPPDWKPGDTRAAFAFFHGAGWAGGRNDWGAGQWCDRLASDGMVAISFAYRVTVEHGADPRHSVRDAKSAIRWMREHAPELGIDPNRIAAGGFSAGGHLAACTAMLEKGDEPGENQSVSSRSNALLLWSAAVDVGGDGWFRQILPAGVAVDDYNPARFIRPGLPPTVAFQGEKDETVNPDVLRRFASQMTAAGNRCELNLYSDQSHLGWRGANWEDVMAKTETFLKSLGYIGGPRQVQ
jgi:acetyl esterase